MRAVVKQINRYAVYRFWYANHFHLFQISKCHLTQCSDNPMDSCIFYLKWNEQFVFCTHHMCYCYPMFCLVVYTIEDTIHLKLCNYRFFCTCQITRIAWSAINVSIVCIEVLIAICCTQSTYEAVTSCEHLVSFVSQYSCSPTWTHNNCCQVYTSLEHTPHHRHT